MVTMRSPFCGYKTAKFVELRGEDFSRCSNKTKSVRERVHGHELPNNAQGLFERYRSNKHFSQFYPQNGSKNQRNCVTATLYIPSSSSCSSSESDSELRDWPESERDRDAAAPSSDLDAGSSSAAGASERSVAK